jgi:hypothetical protein
MVSPDSHATACLRSGRNSTYRPVQISEASSFGESVAAKEGVCHYDNELLWILQVNLSTRKHHGDSGNNDDERQISSFDSFFALRVARPLQV